MVLVFIFFLYYCIFIGLAANNEIELRVHNGFIDINNLKSGDMISSYVVNQEYTFEVYLHDPMSYDYMIERCTMNGREIIGKYGCAQCGQCVKENIETESYNRPGAVKRTLVHFVAQSSQIYFKCDINRIQCSGCAERSCQRQNRLAMSHYVSTMVHKEHPISGSYSSPGLFSLPSAPVAPPPFYPSSPHIYPTPYFGAGADNGGGVFANAPPGAPAAQPSATSYGGGGWPWWLWLLLLLLLLLLLCCLLALCLAAWLRKRKSKKTTTTTTTTVTGIDCGKDAGVGTDKVQVHCVSTGTEDIVKCQPAMVVGGCDDSQYHQHQKRVDGYEDGNGVGGSYSVREGRLHEEYTKTIPRETYSLSNQSDRYAHRERFERPKEYDSHPTGRWNDRTSYRNFAYERDLGRVEPLDGFDEVETRERTYCLSDDEQEVIEKEVKRTHTTRFAQETRDYDTDEEKFRGEEHQHANYTHSLPV